VVPERAAPGRGRPGGGPELRAPQARHVHPGGSGSRAARRTPRRSVRRARVDAGAHHEDRMSATPEVDARILVVDDEPAVEAMVVEFLTEQGYGVRAETSAEAGLAAFASWRPDAILTDINLPGQSGIDLIRSVKDQDPEACVVVMTGQATARTAIEALRH